MKQQKCEIEHWENVRRDMKIPKEDNNDGYVYGVYLLDEDDIIDVEWFKNDQERFNFIKKHNLKIVND
tara:strand:- start:356 stop:559 length:204 start_codon:yes stop_codon:yes gene_type:complete